MKLIELFESIQIPEYFNDIKMTQEEVLLAICIFDSTEKPIQDVLAGGINYMEEQNITVSNTPELLELFTKLKPAIIKMLLDEIKLAWYEWVLNKINQLTKAGFKWSEFSMIKHSLEHERLLKEDDEFSDDNDDSWNSGEKWIIHHIKKNEIWDIMLIFNDMMKENESFSICDYPDIIKAFNKNKRRMLKSMLKLIKNNSNSKLVLGNLNRTVSTFIKAGLTWPELATIHHSLDHIEKNILDHLNEDEKDDRDKDNWEKQVVHIIEQNALISAGWNFRDVSEHPNPLTIKDFPKIANTLAINKSKIITSILKMFKANSIDNLNFMIINFINFGVDWPELKVMRRSLEHEYSKIKKLQETDHDKVIANATKEYAITQAIAYFNQGTNGYHIGLGLLMQCDADVRENSRLQEFFESIKKQIIKYLLDQIAVPNFDKNDARYVLATVNDFLRIGLRWPELYTIQNSMMHEYSNQPTYYANNDDELFENTDEDDQQFQERLDDFFDVVRSSNTSDHDINYCLHWIHAYLTPFSQFDLAKQLEPYKKRLIRAVLSEMFKSIRAAGTSIKALRALGANWPEFDTIQKSIDYELSKSKKLTEDRDQTWVNDQILRLMNSLTQAGREDLIIYNLYRLRPNLLNDGLTIPNIADKLLPHKRKIMVALLDEMRNDLPTSKYVIQALRNLGVTWSELNIIGKSVDHELEKRYAPV